MKKSTKRLFIGCGAIAGFFLLIGILSLPVMFYLLLMTSFFVMAFGLIVVIKPFWIFNTRSQGGLVIAGGFVLCIVSIIGGIFSISVEPESEPVKEPTVSADEKSAEKKPVSSEKSAEKKPVSVEQHVKNVVHMVYGEKENFFEDEKDTVINIEVEDRKVIADIYYGSLLGSKNFDRIAIIDKVKKSMKGIFNRKEVKTVFMEIKVAATDQYGNPTDMTIARALLSRDNAEKINWELITDEQFSDLVIFWWHPSMR